MRYFVKRRLSALSTTIAASMTLTACGGGGGEGSGLIDIITGTSVTLTAQASSATTISLSWTAPSGGVTLSSYNVARNDDQSSSTIGNTTSRNYNVAGLQPGTQYCFVIKNPLTAGVISNTACATTRQDTTPPTTPAGLTASAISSAEVELSWGFASDDDFIAGYNVYRDGVLIATVSPIAMTDSDAVPETEHCYRVSAVDRAGNESSRSSEICATTPADTEDPTIPANVVAVLSEVEGQSVINITWTASTDDGVVKYYKIYRNDVHLTDWPETTFEDAGLLPDTSYCYTISAVDAAGKESGLSERSCAREGWSEIELEAEFALATAVATDSADAVHIAFKQHIFDSGLGQIRHPLTYVQLDPGQPPSPGVVDDGTETFFFDDAYRLSMVIDQNDTVHIAHKQNEPPFDEQIRHLQIAAGSTTPGQIIASTDNMDSISLGVDSMGAIHACFGLGGALYYANNSSGAWALTDTATLVPGTAGYECDLAIDSSDSIHISFLDNLNSDLMYLSNASGSWASELIDEHSDIPTATIHNTSIAVDPTGNAHIAYYHDFAANDLEYATNESGSWVSAKLESDGDVGQACEIAIDSQGYLHIAYQDRTMGTQARYASNKTGAWESYILKSASSGDMAIAIDSADKIHVTFPGGNGVIYMTNR